jgi:hypothetical protein
LVSIATQRFIRKTRFDSISGPISIMLGRFFMFVDPFDFLYLGGSDKVFIGLDLSGFWKAGGLN